MKKVLFFLFIPFFFCSWPSRDAGRILISIPSVEQESESIWQTIRNIHFFEQQGYQVKLPEGELIDNLKAKSRAGHFSEQDYAAILQFMQNGAYRTADYEKGLANVEQVKPLVNRQGPIPKGNAYA